MLSISKEDRYRRILMERDQQKQARIHWYFCRRNTLKKSQRGQSQRTDPFSAIQSGTLAGSTGKAGAVTINTGNMEIRDGGVVNSITTGPGEGGRVDVTTGDSTDSNWRPP